MIEMWLCVLAGFLGGAFGAFWFSSHYDDSLEHINKWQKKQEEINKMFLKYFDEIEKEFERRETKNPPKREG